MNQRNSKYQDRARVREKERKRKKEKERKGGRKEKKRPKPQKKKKKISSLQGVCNLGCQLYGLGFFFGGKIKGFFAQQKTA